MSAYGLNAGMVSLLEKPTNPPTKRISDAHRAESKRVRTSLNKTLAQSIDLKDLAYQTAMELKTASGQEQAMESRAKCQAVASAIKAWDMACDRSRVIRKVALPGSLRPESKPTKRKAQPSMFSETKPE